MKSVDPDVLAAVLEAYTPVGVVTWLADWFHADPARLARKEAGVKAEWSGQWPEPYSTEPMELTCEDCGRDYPVWFAPNEIWNLGDDLERPGFECPSCFAAKYEAWLGKRVAWRFEPEDHQSQDSGDPA